MRYAAEDCPVNRMKDRDAGAWDAQALCGLFQCPDLCQDFGHGSSRNHAAMGSLPSAGLVRSKNNSMARAGIW